MFIFMLLINISATICNFLLVSISAIISSNKIKMLCFYLDCIYHYFNKYRLYYLDINKNFRSTLLRLLISNLCFSSLVSLYLYLDKQTHFISI